MDAETPSEAPPAERSRRRFLEIFVGLFSSLIAAALAIPFLGAVIGGRSGAGKSGFAPVSRVDSLPLGRPTDVAYAVPTSDAFISQETVHHIWVVRRSDSEIVAYSPVCPHLGCRFDWNEGDSRFQCPCHGSVFTLDGRVIAGPSPRPLDTLPAEVRQGTLYVKWERFKVGTADKTPV